MHAHQTLHTLLEREERDRDDALLDCHRADGQLARARGQAEHLARHRSETIARWNERSRLQSSVEMLHTYRGFMQRLDQALAHQESMVERLQEQLERARAALMAAETRVAAVRKLIERRASAERTAARRRDDKRADEAAQRANWQAGRVGEYGSHF